LVAQAPISEGETVMYIPKEVMLNSGGLGEVCDTLQVFLEELDKGDQSDYDPYMKDLFGSDDTTGLQLQLPTSWSQDAQNLLKRILGRDLLPHKFKKTCVRQCKKVCAEDDDNRKSAERKQLEQKASPTMTLTTSAWSFRVGSKHAAIFVLIIMKLLSISQPNMFQMSRE
jgi:hypothetical protein